MKSTSLVILMVLLMNLVKCDDLHVGSTVGSQLAYKEDVKLTGIPLTTRTKNVFFSSETNQIIRGVSAIDINKSTAKATITSGGIGFSFVNVRLKSEKGDSLVYQVQIFV